MTDDFAKEDAEVSGIHCVFCECALIPGHDGSYTIIIYSPDKPGDNGRGYWACGSSDCRDKDDIEQILADLNINAVIGEY